MAYDEKYLRGDLAHGVVMEGRDRLSVSGVEDVESFDENEIVMCTSSGILVVCGEALHIDKLSLDKGELTVEGRIDSLHYEEDTGGKTGFFSRLFK